MSSHLKIDLNGPFDARLCDETSISIVSRRGQALLAYLAMQPKLCASRGAIMTLLWGERPEEQARASLRQELSILRRILPKNVLTADRLNVWLTNTEVIEPAEHELLAGFDLNTPTFDEWLRDTRLAFDEHDASPSRAELRKAGRPSLAVLPFEEFGGVHTDTLPNGIVEEITGSLSRIREFHVIARQSACALKEERLNVVEAARRLGVEYLVTGVLHRAQEKVRVSVQLVDGRDGRTLWAEKYDEHLGDLFDLLDRVSVQIAGQILPSLRDAEIRRVRTQPPADLTAYEHLLRAYPHFWSHSRDQNLKAIFHLDQALEKDHEYAHALALKAWCLAQHPTYMWSAHPEADRAAALKCASAAAPLAGPHAPTLTAVGAAFSIAGTDAGAARSYIDRALEIDPSNAWAWLRRGWHGVYTGEIESAEIAFQNAIELSPLDPFKFNMLTGRASLLMLWTKRFDEAIAMLEEGLRLNPSAAWQYRELIPAYYRAGQLEKLRYAGEQLKKAYPGLTVKELSRSFAKINRAIDDQYVKCFIEAGIPPG